MRSMCGLWVSIDTVSILGPQLHMQRGAVQIWRGVLVPHTCAGNTCPQLVVVTSASQNRFLVWGSPCPFIRGRLAKRVSTPSVVADFGCRISFGSAERQFGGGGMGAETTFFQTKPIFHFSPMSPRFFPVETTFCTFYHFPGGPAGLAETAFPQSKPLFPSMDFQFL